MAAVSASAAAAAAGASRADGSAPTSRRSNSISDDVVLNQYNQQVVIPAVPSLSRRYESQKRRDWNTFMQYLRRNHHEPTLTLSRCSGAHVLEFLKYLDQFGKTKVHADTCPLNGQPHPPAAPCPCPLRRAWGCLDAIIGRLRAAFEENGRQPDTNPFCSRSVRTYLREVRDSQNKVRGFA